MTLIGAHRGMMGAVMEQRIHQTSQSAATFVGRLEELAAFKRVMTSAAQGVGRVVVLAGAPGIGKTRLAERLSAQARQGGLAVHWARCWEWGGAPAFWPWVQLIRGIARATSSEQVARWLGDERDRVGRLVPQLLDASEDLQEIAAGTEARFALFEATTHFLRQAALEMPLLLVIDDLHAADPSSLHLLRFLSREIRELRLVVLTTCRDVARQTTPEMELLLDDLARDALRLTLNGLGADDVSALVETMTGVQPQSGTLSALVDASGGNPFFLEGLVSGLASRGGLEQIAQGGYEIPASVRGAIDRRLEPFVGEARDILAAAAIIGRASNPPLVARVSQVATPRVVEVLGQAADCGLMVSGGPTPWHYTFAHSLIAEALRRDLEVLPRLELHRRTAEALEQIHADELEPVIEELAHHSLAWAVVGDAAKGIAYARRAGAVAMGMCAYAEAAGHYGRALEALDLSGASDVALRCALALDLGDAQLLAGQPGARDSFARAAGLARDHHDAEGLARAAMGVQQTAAWGVVDWEAVGLLEEAASGLEDQETPLRVRVLARTAAALWADAASAERRDALSRQVVRLARRLDDDATLGAALCARLETLWDPAMLDERVDLADELATLAARARDPGLQLEGHRWGMNCAWERGDIARADAELLGYTQIAQTLRSSRALVSVALRHVVQRELAGDLPGIEAAVEVLVQRARQANDPLADGYRAVALLVPRRERGDIDAIEADLDVVRDTARRIPGMPEVQTSLMGALLLTGRQDEAQRLFERLAADDLAHIPQGFGTVAAFGRLALACETLGNRQHALALYERLLPHAEQAAVAGLDASCGAVARYLGRLAVMLDRPEPARAHFTAALAINARMGARGWLAYTQRDFARFLRRQPAPADSARAAALIDETRALAETLGFTVLAASLDSAPSAAPPREPPNEPEAEFRREAEYWTVRFGGVTARMRHSRGLAYIAELIAARGQELHVLQLAGESDPRAQRLAESGAHTSEAMLDPRAKAAYRARLEDLRADLTEAEAWNDHSRARKARAELEAIAAQLVASVGLGGRDRPSGTSSRERARVAVTRAIKRAIDRAERTSPTLSHHLRNAIRTGTYCAYDPEPSARVAWRT